MTGKRRTVSRLTPAVVSLLLVACSASSVPPITSAPATTAPSPSPSASALHDAISPSPSGASVKTARPPTGRPSPVAQSEPWLMYHWFVPGSDERGIYLAHADGFGAHRILDNMGSVAQ